VVTNTSRRRPSASNQLLGASERGLPAAFGRRTAPSPFQLAADLKLVRAAVPLQRLQSVLAT